MHEAGHSKLVLWDNPEGWGGKGDGRGAQDGRTHVHPWLIHISVVVHWLGLQAPNAEGPSSIPDQGTRSHVPQLKIPHAAMKMEDPVCHN